MYILKFSEQSTTQSLIFLTCSGSYKEFLGISKFFLQFIVEILFLFDYFSNLCCDFRPYVRVTQAASILTRSFTSLIMSRPKLALYCRRSEKHCIITHQHEIHTPTSNNNMKYMCQHITLIIKKFISDIIAIGLQYQKYNVLVICRHTLILSTQIHIYVQ